ncbi:MAG: hypothetical protein KAV87_09190 [Desulfobacteraceae bacterium]|nr:hypothetical protein [Desulfobacteraceae bacterium]
MNLARVSIDNNRITHIDGKPFFPVLARHIPEGGTPQLLAAAGFNGYRWTAFGTETADISPVPDQPVPDQNEGLYFYAYIFDRATFSKNTDYKRQLEELVKQVKDHPNLLCYENYNEVAIKWRQWDYKASPEELAEGSKYLRTLDPNHPIWLAHSPDRTIETLATYNESMDIVGANPSPIQPRGMRPHVGAREDGRVCDCPEQSIHFAGRLTDKMMQVGRNEKAIWMLIQAMPYEHWFGELHCPEMAGQSIDPSMCVYPTYEQLRFMAYDAIIAGATGLSFSMYKVPIEHSAFKDISRVVKELRTLNDALTARPFFDPIEISYTDLGYSIWDGMVTLMRRKGDDVYLFAANTAFDPAEVTMQIPGIVNNTAALVQSEDRELAVENSSLSDYFEPYAVHVYKLKGTK